MERLPTYTVHLGYLSANHRSENKKLFGEANNYIYVVAKKNVVVTKVLTFISNGEKTEKDQIWAF